MFDPKSQHAYTLNSSATPINGNTHNLEYQNISARVRKPAQNYQNNMRVNFVDIQFRAKNTDDESDVISPPLWKSGSPNNYRNLSPNSRTRAILNGQRELMEMARNMSESCYELSLRDMVQSPIIESRKLDDEERCLVDEKNFDSRKSVKKILRQESKKAEKRMEKLKSASFEKRGLFLKTMFPVSIRSKKKKNFGTNTSNKRVSPKVETLGKSSDKDWWKKRFSGSSGSESGVTNTSSASSKSTSTSSSGNSSINSRKSKGWSSGCWSFAFSRKNKRKSN